MSLDRGTPAVMARVGLVAAGLAMGGPLSAQAPAGFSAAWDRTARAFHDSVRREGIVGSSLAFLAGSEVLAWEVDGMADLATNRPVDRNTIYHWASITKTFTGIAIMQLRDRGRLRLDDPVTRYLPELRAVHDPYGSMDDVTIRHLLTHSAGFRDATWPWGGSEPWHPHEPTEWSQLVAMFPYTTLHFAPGTESRYSNPGIIFLGRIIELLSGDDYEVYMDKNVLRPLGMSGSYFDRTPYHLLGDRSNNYTVTEGDTVANGLDFDTGITVSNGGLNAPIGDMLRYLQFLTGYADTDDARGVLSRESLAEMWERHFDWPSEDGTTVGMGLTYFLLEHGQTRVIGHTGGQKSFVSFFYVDPASGAAAIAAFNTLGGDDPPRPDTRRVLADVRTDLFEHIFPLFSARATGAR